MVVHWINSQPIIPSSLCPRKSAPLSVILRVTAKFQNSSCKPSRLGTLWTRVFTALVLHVNPPLFQTPKKLGFTFEALQNHARQHKWNHKCHVPIYVWNQERLWRRWISPLTTQLISGTCPDHHPVFLASHWLNNLVYTKQVSRLSTTLLGYTTFPPWAFEWRRPRGRDRRHCLARGWVRTTPQLAPPTSCIPPSPCWCSSPIQSRAPDQAHPWYEKWFSSLVQKKSKHGRLPWHLMSRCSHST